MLGIDLKNNFTGGLNENLRATLESVSPSIEKDSLTPGEKIGETSTKDTVLDEKPNKKPDIPTSGTINKKEGNYPDINGDLVVIPKGASGVVFVRSDKQNYKRKILDFAEDYSRVLAVTFGVSAFLFNLGSTTVLNKRSLIWSGMAVVIIVVAFLVYHDREKLFYTEGLRNGQNTKK